MPAPAVVYHETRTEVAFSHDGTPHVVSLTPYLSNPSDVALVVFQTWNQNILGPPNAVTQIAGDVRSLVHEGCTHYADAPSGPNNEVTLSADTTAAHITIVAELLAPGTVIHPTRINRSPTQQSEQNTWVNKTVTLEGGDSAGDVEAVIVTALTNIANSNDSHVGIRGYGSTTARTWHSVQHTDRKFFVIAAPNGQYQLYIDGDSKSFKPYAIAYELGYIKKGYGLTAILNYVDEVPAASTGWETRSTTTVPVGAEGMFAIQRETPEYLTGTGLWFHGLRSIGSSDIERICPSVAPCDSCDPVKLDSSRQFEFSHYRSGTGPVAPELWITAYTTAVSLGTGSGTIKLLGQADLTVLTPATQLTASIEIEAVMSARAQVLAELGADLSVVSVVSGTPALG